MHLQPKKVFTKTVFFNDIFRQIFQATWIFCYSVTALPFDTDDQMGRTWSANNGAFVLSGCGSDFGPFNAPDPYVTIEHNCPSIQRRNGNEGRRKMQFQLTKTFLPNILRIGKVFLDDSDA